MPARTVAGTVSSSRPRQLCIDPGEAAPELTARAALGGSGWSGASVGTLVERARRDDMGAWSELVARFNGMIAAAARRYRLVPADVAEVQQATWLLLLVNLHRIEQPERVGGWLATTARRESLQVLRRACRYSPRAAAVFADLPDHHLPEPDARPIAEEREAVLRAAWARLQPRCQHLLSLLIADDERIGYRDISALLRMPVGSIGPTRGRCLEHLRRLVEQEGMTSI